VLAIYVFTFKWTNGLDWIYELTNLRQAIHRFDRPLLGTASQPAPLMMENNSDNAPNHGNQVDENHALHKPSSGCLSSCQFIFGGKKRELLPFTFFIECLGVQVKCRRFLLLSTQPGHRIVEIVAYLSVWLNPQKNEIKRWTAAVISQ
jgi:hypothetical protein